MQLLQEYYDSLKRIKEGIKKIEPQINFYDKKKFSQNVDIPFEVISTMSEVELYYYYLNSMKRDLEYVIAWLETGYDPEEWIGRRKKW